MDGTIDSKGSSTKRKAEKTEKKNFDRTRASRKGTWQYQGDLAFLDGTMYDEKTEQRGHDRHGAFRIKTFQERFLSLLLLLLLI